jgi:hypothetical protein
MKITQWFKSRAAKKAAAKEAEILQKEALKKERNERLRAVTVSVKEKLIGGGFLPIEWVNYNADAKYAKIHATFSGRVFLVTIYPGGGIRIVPENGKE